MIFSAGAIFYLRKKTADLDPKTIYTMKLYPLMPIIFIASYVFVAISIYNEDPQAALNGIYIFFGFIVIYFVRKFLKTRKA